MLKNRIGLNSFAAFFDQLPKKPAQNLQETELASIIHALAYAKDNDFDFVEVALDYPLLGDQNLKGRLRDCVRDVGLPVNVHAPFIDLSISSHNPFIREASIKSVNASIDLAKDLRAGAVTFHPGYRNSPIMYVGNGYFNNLVEVTRQIVSAHKGKSPRLCLENMPAECNLCGTIEEIEKVLNSQGLEDLFLCMDTSHLYTCKQDPAQLWEKLHSRIGNVHLVDNRFFDRDPHFPLGQGKVDFQKICQLLAKYEYSFDILIELHSLFQCKKGRAFIRRISE